MHDHQAATASGTGFRLTEATIAELASALDAGIITSVELVALHLNRIAYYDRQGIRLNAVPVLNPAMFDEAAAADRRRARGECRGPLDGIPYLAKDSYAARGLTVAAGAPAFEHLVAGDDAFVVARLRAAGAVLVGLTNMPPMAAGGMQRGVYGRAESPYNADFLAAAYASGSSNGSGTGVAASLGVFGLAEETWSSGRAPASNGGLVAYTPSRGVISVRGNWPLIPTMDVVVPYARSMDDLLAVLNVIVADDPETRGDFWRAQAAVSLPAASAVRPGDYRTLAVPDALAGKRLGVPRMYLNRDPDSTRPIATRPAVIAAWEAAAGDLRALGAEIVEVDFPLVTNYEGDRPGTRSLVERGLVPPGFAEAEGIHLITFAWHDYLVANGDPALDTLAAVDGSLIIPSRPDALPDRYEGIPDFREFPLRARDGVMAPDDIPDLAAGLRGLERARKLDLEDWMNDLGLDALVFPAVADIAPADVDTNPHSNDIAWRNGTWVANGNQVIRHCGVPTVTVPMGLLDDIRMPIGLTFAGRGWDDNALLGYAWAFEQSGQRRCAPPRTPPLPGEALAGAIPPTPPRTRGEQAPTLTLDTTVTPMADDGNVTITVTATARAAAGIAELRGWLNGTPLDLRRDGDTWRAEAHVPASLHTVPHSRWRRPYGSLVTVLARDVHGSAAAVYAVVGGIG
ncbi:MAG: amidase [Gammaproteobacteria bacterium]|nr:amidase [Gammaproteobacteria bacterium]